MGPDCRAEGRIIGLKETAFGSRVCRKTKASIMGKGDEWRQTGPSREARGSCNAHVTAALCSPVLPVRTTLRTLITQP